METLFKENELKIYESKINDFLDKADHAKDYKEKDEILYKLGNIKMNL